jgi:hypothetical protein
MQSGDERKLPDDQFSQARTTQVVAGRNSREKRGPPRYKKDSDEVEEE